jgi:hypothetical protein
MNRASIVAFLSPLFATSKAPRQIDCLWRATVDEDGHYSFAIAL